MDENQLTTTQRNKFFLIDKDGNDAIRNALKYYMNNHDFKPEYKKYLELLHDNFLMLWEETKHTLKIEKVV